MTNQQIVDRVEDSLPSKLPATVKEKVLDAVWTVLNDHLGIDIDPTTDVVGTDHKGDAVWPYSGQR